MCRRALETGIRYRLKFGSLFSCGKRLRKNSDHIDFISCIPANVMSSTSYYAILNLKTVLVNKETCSGLQFPLVHRVMFEVREVFKHMFL